jgi:hypothetical protein
VHAMHVGIVLSATVFIALIMTSSAYVMLKARWRLRASSMDVPSAPFLSATPPVTPPISGHHSKV